MSGDKFSKGKKVTTIGFAFIFLLFFIVGITSCYEINSLGNLTKTIYRHPLEVSNASLSASMGVVKMHRDMKDVVLSESSESLEKSVALVDEGEKEVFEKLKIIDEKILGEEGQALAKETTQLFVEWRPIREEVISLVRNGDRDSAADITRGKGAAHQALLESKLLSLTAYARNKADGFIEDALRVQNRSSFLVILIVSIGLCISALIAVATIRKNNRFINLWLRYKRELEKSEKKFKDFIMSAEV